MKVPFSWLKEFVDIDVTAQELEEKLFSCGFEVEELIPLDAGISKVVVGKIVEMEKQEGTHLTKCVVDCGAYGHEIRISTGAANMKLGDCVPTALDGSTLPGGITIKARKMQGVESNGMLCSGAELGLNDDLFPGSEVYGLLILPEDSVPGTDIAPVVGLDDYIFDISITANRPDCQSVLGIAREVSAILGKPLHMPAMDYKAVCEPDAPITVKVEAPDLCPRYMAHYVRNIRMGESPRWMKRHLALCGLRLAEGFTGQGFSKQMDDICWYFLPFQNEDGQMLVWAYEAIVAAVALVIVLVQGRRQKIAGRTLETGLTIISVMQVLLDSWRADELIRFGFVRLNMLMAALTLAGCVPEGRTEPTGERPVTHTRERYFEMGREIYEWGVENLFDAATGRVADSRHGEPDWKSHVYNQGTFIGASVLLYRATGEERYLTNALLAADYVMRDMSKDGILPFESGIEQGIYTAIYAQYMAMLVYDCGQRQYLPFLRHNISAGWANRDAARDICGGEYARRVERGQTVDSYSASGIPALMLLFATDRR